MRDRHTIRIGNPYAPYEGWRRRRQRDRQVALLGGVIFLFAFGIIWKLKQPKTLYAIYVNQRPWAYVKSHDEAKEVKDEALKRKVSGKKGARVIEHVSIREVDKKGKELDSYEVALSKLESVLTVVSAAKVLLVNGKPVFSAPDETIIKAALEKIKRSGVPANKGPLKYVAFKENVEIAQKEVKSPGVASVEEALSKLRSTTTVQEKAVYYTVKKGDMGWEIAQKFHVPIKTLVKMNPGANLKSLRIGQSLKVSVSPGRTRVTKSILTVVAKKEVRETSKVPAPVVMQKTDKLFRGEKKVLKDGKPGMKEEIAVVVYENGVEKRRNVLWRKVTKKPQPKIIQVGIKPKTQTSRYFPSVFGRGYGTKMAYVIYQKYRHGNYKGHFRGVYGMKELGVSVGVAHSLDHAFGVHFAEGLSWSSVYTYLARGDRSFGGRWGCSGGPHDPYGAARWVKQYILK